MEPTSKSLPVAKTAIRSLFHGVAWSPDGNMVFCPAGIWENGWHMNLVAFDLKTWSEQLIGNQSWFSIQQVAWQQDMNGLVISATERQTSRTSCGGSLSLRELRRESPAIYPNTPVSVIGGQKNRNCLNRSFVADMGCATREPSDDDCDRQRAPVSTMALLGPARER